VEGLPAVGNRPLRNRPFGSGCGAGRLKGGGWAGDEVQVEEVRHRSQAGTAAADPRGDRVEGRVVEDEPQPHRPGTSTAAGRGRLDHDHVGVLAHVEALADPYPGRA